MILRKGEFITVNETTDNWWLGKRGDTKGFVPSNYVEIIEIEDLEPLETQHTSSGLL